MLFVLAASFYFGYTLKKNCIIFSELIDVKLKNIYKVPENLKFGYII